MVEVIKFVASLHQREPQQGTKNPRTIAAMEAARLLPHADDSKQWLLALMRDPRQDLRHRVEAARALLPYLHARPG